MGGDRVATGRGRRSAAVQVAVLVGMACASPVLAQCGPQWSSVGPAFNGAVLQLNVLPNGDVLAGGFFTTAGGATVNRIARLSGGAWSALGSGLNNTLYAQTVTPGGDVIAGGQFTSAGGTPASFIARWNSSAGTWSPLGSGMNTWVQSTAIGPGGALIAGGDFTMAGGAPASHLARWDGVAWSPIISGMSGISGANAYKIAVMPGGDLVVGGLFDTAAGLPARYVIRWNGTTWSTLGTGLNSSVLSLYPLPNGDLLVGGHFTMAGGAPASHIARWNAASGTWSAIGAGTNSAVHAMALMPNGDLMVGGQFTSAGGTPAPYLARWDGSTWSPLDQSINDYVDALLVLPSGDILLGGAFTGVGGVPGTAYIARCSIGFAVVPATQTVAPGSPASFTISGRPASGYQWRKDTINISGATSVTYTISSATAGDAGSYDCLVTTQCGAQLSSAAVLAVSCYANCDGSISPPVLNANDFQCFLNTFAALDSYANCDGSTAPPVLNANDFQCFLNTFAAGCD